MMINTRGGDFLCMGLMRLRILVSFLIGSRSRRCGISAPLGGESRSPIRPSSISNYHATHALEKGNLLGK